MMKESIKLLVKPGSSRNSIEGIHEGRIKIKITAQPQNGKANKELIKFLSGCLHVPPSSIRIVSGNFSNIKEIQVEGKSCSEIADILISSK